MLIGIATDHGGFSLKQELPARLDAAGHEIVDFGAHDLGSIHDHFSAQQGVEDDHMNIICLGGRIVGPSSAWDFVQAFLAAEPSRAERHLRRLGKVASLEAHAVTNLEV